MHGAKGFCFICHKECFTYACPSDKSVRLCRKHVEQYRKYGYYLDNNSRTVWDPNEIRKYVDYAEVDTYDSKGLVLVTYKIDIEDIVLLGNHKWRTVFKGKRKSPYLVTGHAGKQGGDLIYFHRLVLKNPIMEVDHINRDTTDNRKFNLRCSDRTQQLVNTRVRTDNSSGIKGVYAVKERSGYKGGYCAQIKYGNLRLNSKTFDTIEEAAYVRYLAEQRLYEGKMNNSVYLLILVNRLNLEKRKEIDDYFLELIVRIESGLPYKPRGRKKGTKDRKPRRSPRLRNS